MIPVISTDELEEGFQYCAGEPIDFSGVFIGDPVRIEWQTISRPPGGQLLLSNDEIADITGTPNVNGEYTLQLCAYYANGADTGFSLGGPFINCPHAWPINTSLELTISDFGDAVQFEWLDGAGVITSDQGSTIVVTMPNTPDATVTLVAELTDIDGVNTFVGCNIQTYDPAQELVIVESEPACFDAIECQDTCFCTSVSFYVGCDEEECLELCIDINPSQPVNVVEDEECIEAVEVPLVGLKSAYTPYPTYTVCDDCDPYELPVNPDMPNFIWNDCARCPNWSVAGEAANASDCNPGSPWCFTGSDTYTVSSNDGSECSVDIIVIYGHNIETATISADVPIFGGNQTFSICYDDAKIGGFTRPLVIPLDGLSTGTSFSFTVDGVGINNQPICIDYAMFGQKLFLPEDALPDDFVNPLDGSDFEFSVKNSECGVISRVAKQRPITWSITIEGPDTWICETWRSYMRYLNAGNPVLFQPSRNNKPQDILLGFKSGQQEGSTYVDCGFSEVTLSVEGFINQPQPKAFAA